MVVEMQKENAFFKSYLETQSADFLRIYLSDFINHSMHFFFLNESKFYAALVSKWLLLFVNSYQFQ